MVFVLFGVFRTKKAELASSFLEWTSDPIHKSLTDVSGLKGEAKKQFKNMLGYCGDRKYQYPDPLIRDIVAKGLEMTELRGELYVQAMKQLTKNANPASVQRCWEVVTMLLTCFPPPKDMENYVHYFVRCNAPEDTREKFKLAVHMSVYDGVKETAPSVKEIPPLLSGFFEREISARYNIEEDVVSVKPTRPPPSRPGWAAAAASAAAASASAAPASATAGSSNGGYGGYGGYSAPPAANNTAAAGGYGGYSAPAAATPAAAAGGYAGGSYGQQAAGANGGGADPAMPAMPSMAAPPLPPKPKPSEPKARVLYDYDPAGQEGMVAVSAGQVVGVTNRDNPDWWMASLDGGVEGWVPANYLEMQ
ncbi:unnamed protein product [Ectocarpus sp. 13 AM-2016]